MDDVRLLNGFLMVLGLAVASAISLFAPGVVLVVGIVTLVIGVNLRVTGTHESERARGKRYTIIGGLLLLPPLIWFAFAVFG